MSELEINRSPIDIPPQLALIQMVTANWVSQIIYVAAKLGIADLLKDRAKNHTELATATQTNSRTLFRLLRALTSIGIVKETESGYFCLTEIGYFLRSDISDSLTAMAIMNGEEHYQAWGNLLSFSGRRPPRPVAG